VSKCRHDSGPDQSPVIVFLRLEIDVSVSPRRVVKGPT
jgi:hypothetical protein